MHVINSVIVKLAKLTAATTVYRGISGFKLPPQFWKPNKFKVAPRSRRDHAVGTPRSRRDHTESMPTVGARRRRVLLHVMHALQRRRAGLRCEPATERAGDGA